MENFDLLLSKSFKYKFVKLKIYKMYSKIHENFRNRLRLETITCGNCRWDTVKVI